MKNFTQGQKVRIKGTFKNFAGSLIDPTFVRFFIQREGDGEWDEFEYGDSDSESSFSSDSSSEIVRVSVGIYYLDVDTSPESGVWNWRIVSSGPYANAKQGQFYVEPMQPDDSESSS